jgi:hypothetical protein
VLQWHDFLSQIREPNLAGAAFSDAQNAHGAREVCKALPEAIRYPRDIREAGRGMPHWSRRRLCCLRMQELEQFMQSPSGEEAV